MMEIDYEVYEELESINRSLKASVKLLRRKTKKDPELDDLIQILEHAMGATQVDIERYEEMERASEQEEQPLYAGGGAFAWT